MTRVHDQTHHSASRSRLVTSWCEKNDDQKCTSNARNFHPGYWCSVGPGSALARQYELLHPASRRKMGYRRTSSCFGSITDGFRENINPLHGRRLQHTNACQVDHVLQLCIFLAIATMLRSAPSDMKVVGDLDATEIFVFRHAREVTGPPFGMERNLSPGLSLDCSRENLGRGRVLVVVASGQETLTCMELTLPRNHPDAKFFEVLNAIVLFSPVEANRFLEYKASTESSFCWTFPRELVFLPYRWTRSCMDNFDQIRLPRHLVPLSITACLRPSCSARWRNRESMVHLSVQRVQIT